jgi:hypothetical protein
MDIGKLILINFASGNLNLGFDSITLWLEDDNRFERKALPTSLPPKPEIVGDYHKWIDKCFPTPSMSWKKASQAFSNTLNAWLKSEPFYSDWNKLLSYCTHKDKIRVIFQTELWELQQIPWQFWDFFQIYPQAEMAFSLPAYESINSSLNEQIRILTIIGDSTGIDTEQDKALIQQLPNVEEPRFLCQPPRSEISTQLWQESWDILFFAGHSKTEQGTGRIYINNHEFLTIEELQEGLKTAINRGLKLAVFNSCDGLGLARSLAGLNIPQVIVMRQPVPDRVAQDFLKYFLKGFSQNGQTLYLAVKEAKNRLREELGNEFPCANWLPVIYQNPGMIPHTWEQLRRIIPSEQKMPTTTDSHSPQPQQSHDKLHQVLQRLNYTHQIRLFRTFFEQHPIGAYLIYGEEESGQKWLLNRLMKQVPDSTNAKVISVTLGRKSRATYTKALWQELGGRVGLINQPSQAQIIDKVAQWFQNRTVVFIFDRLDQMPEECMSQFIGQFWLPLVKSVCDVTQSSSRLLMFLIDHSGCVEEWNNVDFAETLSPCWEPHIPVKLPKITLLREQDLTFWIENGLDDLPLKLTTQVEESVRDILESSEGGLPQLALYRICDLCDCNWYEWEKIWLKH